MLGVSESGMPRATLNIERATLQGGGKIYLTF